MVILAYIFVACLVIAFFILYRRVKLNIEIIDLRNRLEKCKKRLYMKKINKMSNYTRDIEP